MKSNTCHRTDDDVQGGTDHLRAALLDLLHRVATSTGQAKSGDVVENGGHNDLEEFFLPEMAPADSSSGTARAVASSTKSDFASQTASRSIEPMIVPVMDTKNALL